MAIVGRLRAALEGRAPKATPAPEPTPARDEAAAGGGVIGVRLDLPLNADGLDKAGAGSTEYLAARIAAARAAHPGARIGVYAAPAAGPDWTRRDTAEAHARAVARLADELAERGASPDLWWTLVAPWRTLIAPPSLPSPTGTGPVGEAPSGPPWTGDPHLPARAIHAALAHGLIAQALRTHDGRTAIGVILDLAVHLPRDAERAADLDAVHASDLVRNHLLVGPLLEGALPPELVAATRGRVDWGVVRPGDLAVTRARLDVLGLEPPEAWVVGEGTAPGDDTADSADSVDSADSASVGSVGGGLVAHRADPEEQARTLHDQLRALDVAHEGLPLLVDLTGEGTPEPASAAADSADTEGAGGEEIEARIAEGVADGFPITEVLRREGAELVGRAPGESA